MKLYYPIKKLIRKLVPTPWNEDLPLHQREASYKKLTNRARTIIENFGGGLCTLAAFLGGAYAVNVWLKPIVDEQSAQRHQEAFYQAGHPTEALEKTCEHAFLVADDDSPYSSQELCNEARKAFIQEKLLNDFEKDDRNLEELLAEYSGHAPREPFPFSFQIFRVGRTDGMEPIPPTRQEDDQTILPAETTHPISRTTIVMRSGDGKTYFGRIEEMNLVSRDSLTREMFFTDHYSTPFSPSRAKAVAYADNQRNKEIRIFFERDGEDVIEVVQPYDIGEKMSMSRLFNVKAVSVANVHPTPGKEIVLQYRDGTIDITDLGRQKITILKPTEFVEKVEIEDIDRDGLLEIIVSSFKRDFSDENIQRNIGSHKIIDIFDLFELSPHKGEEDKAVPQKPKRSIVSTVRLTESVLSLVPPLYVNQFGDVEAISLVEIDGGGGVLRYYDSTGSLQRTISFHPEQTIINLEQHQGNQRCSMIWEGKNPPYWLPHPTLLFTVDSERGAMVKKTDLRDVAAEACLYFPENEIIVAKGKWILSFYDLRAQQTYHLPSTFGGKLFYLPTVGEKGSLFVEDRRDSGTNLLAYDASLLELPRYLRGSLRKNWPTVTSRKR